MPTKDAYQEQVNAHIATLYDSLEHHERHLQSTESVSLESHEAALRDLKDKHRLIDGLLKELEDATEHGWRHLCDGIDTGLDELKQAIKQARERFRRDQ